MAVVAKMWVWIQFHNSSTSVVKLVYWVPTLSPHPISVGPFLPPVAHSHALSPPKQMLFLIQISSVIQFRLQFHKQLCWHNCGGGTMWEGRNEWLGTAYCEMTAWEWYLEQKDFLDLWNHYHNYTSTNQNIKVSRESQQNKSPCLHTNLKAVEFW